MVDEITTVPPGDKVKTGRNVTKRTQMSDKHTDVSLHPSSSVGKGQFPSVAVHHSPPACSVTLIYCLSLNPHNDLLLAPYA